MKPGQIFLSDYKAPTYQILSTELTFNIENDVCRVLQKSSYKSIYSNSPPHALFLDGSESLILESIKLNGIELSASAYRVAPEGLTLAAPPAEFNIEITTLLGPHTNSSLEGLYAANNGQMLCTQCEAQGFRKITYFLDRPDVMTIFTVHIQADKKKYPTLLSNGNLTQSKLLDNGRLQVTWHDPHKKPCYLFALVAGDLGLLKDEFKTLSGAKVSLEIYSAHGTQARCHHAMESLKKSMAWDEQRFGREYDLSTYMIVAADDFNAGAMENKGLNIFNSRLVFADSATATDVDYFNIEGVIAHEYFHNWTGNRVTLRDWFHLSLKEGLTVFRDQEFSMDMSSREMVRIDSVADLRSRQFAEDAGPNAHPIRPESCFAVDNFFTSTIYEKGSEVIRMMQTMVGRPGFRKGMDLYFSRHDGQAVVIEDFAKAIADANNQNWEQFKLWYSQAGTPQIKVQESYSDNDQSYTVEIEQSCPPTPNQTTKKPFHIPLVIGLLDERGVELEFTHPQVAVNSEGQKLIHLKEQKQSYIFKNLKSRPHLSINRQFSAPITVNFERSLAEHIFMLRHDTDSFNRWEASQVIMAEQFKVLLKDTANKIDKRYLEALGELVTNTDLPEDFRAALLTLPDNEYLSQSLAMIDGPSLHNARSNFQKQIAQALEVSLISLYKQFHGINTQSKSAKDFGRRRLKNLALRYLCHIETHLPLAVQQQQNAANMTDEVAALSILVDQPKELRSTAIHGFYERWKNESLVLNKWFQTQALSTSTETFATVVELMKHPDFNIKNPNRVYAVLLRFGENLVRFHDEKNPTYKFMADQIIAIDKINPQVATRVAGAFDTWQKLAPDQKKKAHVELQRMAQSGLSKNTYEIVSKQLAAELP